MVILKIKVTGKKESVLCQAHFKYSMNINSLLWSLLLILGFLFAIFVKGNHLSFLGLQGRKGKIMVHSNITLWRKVS